MPHLPRAWLQKALYLSVLPPVLSEAWDQRGNDRCIMLKYLCETNVAYSESKDIMLGISTEAYLTRN